MSIDHLATSARRSPVHIALLAGLALVLIAALSILVAGRTHAVHGGIHPENMARVPFADPTAIQLRGLVGGKMNVSNANNVGETLIQKITVDPGGFTGWHTHPGPVVVLVVSGTFDVYQANDPTCTAYSYGPDEAFIDPGQGNVHSARNNSQTVPMVAWAVYFDVPADLPSPFIGIENPGDSCAEF
jgi:quercetin dioxygenase-like cupin family protein